MDDIKLYAAIDKFDKKEQMVWGYASTEALDSQGEIVKKNALASAIDDYMKFANIREMHQPSAVGKTKKANLDSKGLYIAAKIIDKEAWAKVEEGVYNGFSIGGRVKMKKGDEITDLSLSEISLVDRPANPECVFDVWKSADGKPEEKVEEKVEDKEEKPAEAPVETPTKDAEKTDKEVEKTPDEKVEVPKEKADKAANLKKCMGTVAELALVIDRLGMMKDHEALEEIMEGDQDTNKTVDMLKENIAQLTDTLKEMVDEETSEIMDEDEAGIDSVAEPVPVLLADKPVELQKIEDAINEFKMPEEADIVKMLEYLKKEDDTIVVDLKAINGARFEIAGQILKKIKSGQDAQMQIGDGKGLVKVKTTTAVAPKTEEAAVPDPVEAYPANTTVTDALSALQDAVKQLTSVMTPPVGNRKPGDNTELSDDAKAKLKNGVKAGSEVTSGGHITDPLENDVQGKADTKELTVAKTWSKDPAYVAKLEADLSALKGQVQKLMDMPAPIKAKATFVTLEKGHEDADNASGELEKLEKRSVELQGILASGRFTEAEIKEASQLSINIMKLRRESTNGSGH